MVFVLHKEVTCSTVYDDREDGLIDHIVYRLRGMNVLY